MFKAMICLLRASDISPQDNDELDIVMSFHNDSASDNSHSLLLTFRSLMSSLKGRYFIMWCIISAGKSVKLTWTCDADIVGF